MILPFPAIIYILTSYCFVTCYSLFTDTYLLFLLIGDHINVLVLLRPSGFSSAHLMYGAFTVGTFNETLCTNLEPVTLVQVIHQLA